MKIYIFSLIMTLVTTMTCAAEGNISIPELTKQAEQGDVTSQFALGGMYICGTENVKQNVQEGIKWLKKAGEQGDAGSYLILGQMYLGGEEVPRDTVEGWRYVTKGVGNYYCTII